jgi:uncharacterized protein YdbL (DUF1318 family)
MRRFVGINLAFVLLVVACVTVNVYFPASAVQKAADEIVDDIRKNGPSPETKSDKSSWLKEGLEHLCGVQVAHAEMNIDVSTPTVRALREKMKGRFPLLKPFYDKGNVGENNRGLLEIRVTEGLGLKDKAQLNGLVEGENKDRTALYKEIVSANKLGNEVMPQVQKLFANSWRQKSQQGWWVETDKGEWEKKK